MDTHPPELHFFDLFMRLSTAMLAGAVLGLHAALRQRPGGLRTSLMTASGAALFCITALRESPEAESLIRAIQGIASGVGFIGGSVVLREGTTVRGVANGAALWIAAAAGCAAGFGDLWLALLGSVFIAIAGHLSYQFEKRVIERMRASKLRPPGDATGQP
jgi:putative Mg2+ transporter-C (MgtC) family protein